MTGLRHIPGIRRLALGVFFEASHKVAGEFCALYGRLRLSRRRERRRAS